MANRRKLTPEQLERRRKRQAGECLLCSQPRYRDKALCYEHHMERVKKYWTKPTKVRRAYRVIVNMRQRSKGDVTENDIQWLLDHVHSCRYCGAELSAEVGEFDHIVPVGMGGKSAGTNIQYICWRCNRAKGDELEADFLLWLDMLKNS